MKIFIGTFSVFSIEFNNYKLKNKVISNLKNKIDITCIIKDQRILKNFFNLGLKKNSFPKSENLSRNILSIPIDPYMKKKDIIKIIKIING